MGKISAPVILTEAHDHSEFDCGTEVLNSWLHERALKNSIQNASRCFVVCDGDKVIGYYAFSAGSVHQTEAPGNIKRNMPNPIPVFVLGRLAIDMNYQGKGLGKHLLKDVMLRALKVSEYIAAKALLVHAISEDAKVFYEAFGFKESPINPMTLFLSIDTLKTLKLKSLRTE